ncbi:uncharacterized protein PG986_003561 [Apiospora aurea]|uniref:Carbohydrate-binding module family 18 protein n=1 Tax=Apiospora aurea TaxID=335848 RepID=A0ABR1QS16_9PEZI
MWRERLQSPTLPDSEFTDYMVEQYEDLQKKCSTTLGYVPYTKTLLLSTPKTTASPTRTAEPTATPACSGQIVTPDPEQLRTCNDITDTFNHAVSATSLRAGHNLPLSHLVSLCSFDYIYICAGIDSEELAKRYSTDSNTVDSTQFLFWNKAIRGSCGSLFNDQRVCKSPPGGHFTPSSTIAAPTAAGEYFTAAKPSLPTQSGTLEPCGLFYNVASGDMCYGISLRFGLDLPSFYKMNTYLDGNCLNLWIDSSACVAPVSVGPVSKDGTCGPSAGYSICTGSDFGICCSTSGFCGSGPEYCNRDVCYSGDTICGGSQFGKYVKLEIQAASSMGGHC